MDTRLRSFTAALAGAGALLVVAPGISVTPAPTAALSVAPVSSAFHLLSKSEWQDAQGYSYGDSDDHGGYDDGYGDDDHHFGGSGNFIADFLANNQATVLAVTAMIPVFYLGPVALGNSLLATAYYNGYNGSAAGIEGVVSYVTSQIGVPPTDIVKGLVLGLTSLIPQFNIGPVAVGNSLLATAFFDGYNGSATGLPGVISYITSQLGLQAAPAAAVAVSAAAAVDAPDSASVAAPAQAARAVVAEESAGPAPALERSAAAAPVADSTTEAAGTSRTSRSSAAASADGAGHAKARAARSAAKSGGTDS